MIMYKFHETKAPHTKISVAHKWLNSPNYIIAVGTP